MNTLLTAELQNEVRGIATKKKPVMVSVGFLCNLGDIFLNNRAWLTEQSLKNTTVVTSGMIGDVNCVTHAELKQHS